MPKKIYVYTQGEWKEVLDVWIYEDGSWKNEVVPFIRTGDQWKATMEYAVPVYSISPSTTSLNEGSSVTMTVTITNFEDAPSTLYWTITGSAKSSDVNPSSGTVFVSTGTGQFSIEAVADETTEGSENFQVQLRKDSTSGEIVATSSTITINDTSTTPITYAISPDTTSINEGGSVIMTVTANNFGSGTLYWGTTGTGAGTDLNPSSGSVSIVNDSGSFSIQAVEDATTEGSETFQVLLKNIGGTTLAESSVITINDTSQTPEQTATPTTATSQFSDTSVSFTITNNDSVEGIADWEIREGDTTGALVASNSEYIGPSSNTSTRTITVEATNLNSGTSYYLTNVYVTSTGKTKSSEATSRVLTTSVPDPLTFSDSDFGTISVEDVSSNQRTAVSSGTVYTSIAELSGDGTLQRSIDSGNYTSISDGSTFDISDGETLSFRATNVSDTEGWFASVNLRRENSTGTIIGDLSISVDAEPAPPFFPPNFQAPPFFPPNFQAPPFFPPNFVEPILVGYVRVKMDLENTTTLFFRTYQYQFSDQSASTVDVDNQNYTTIRSDFEEGKDLQMTATDDFANHEFAGWYVNGSLITTSTSLTITNITESLDIEAYYSDIVGGGDSGAGNGTDPNPGLGGV